MTPSLEIAHVLFMDVVAYTKLSMDRQQRLLAELQEAVRSTQEFIQAQTADNLICLPTGDGMALVFFVDPESPVRCAMELSGALRGHPDIRLRMGIHTGPVYRVADINANLNITGGGINFAQRVMDYGDAGHILVTRAVADVLLQVGTWSQFLHDLGDVELKHGLRVHIYNLYSNEAGYAELPKKMALARRGETPTPPPEPWWKTVRLWMRHRKRALAAMLLLGTACVVLAWRACPPPPQKQRIMAVFPMDAVGQDAKTIALGLGLTETVAAKLVEASNRDSIQIISPRDLKDEGVITAADAHRIFNSNLCLESSVQRLDQTIRINCSLVYCAIHTQFAAKSIESKVANPFVLQDSIVSAALSMLSAQIRQEEPQVGKVNSLMRTIADAIQQGMEWWRVNATAHINQDAYAAYLRGRGYLQEYERPENIDSAISEFALSIQKDPNYAPAYAGVADAYWIGYQQLKKGQEWLTKASYNCEKALEINPDLADGHICKGHVLYESGEYAKAVEQFQRALEINYNSHTALDGLADAYMRLGKPSEAEDAYKKAIILRPDYWGVHSWLGSFYYNQGRYADAAAQFEKATELAPDNDRSYSNLSAMYALQGRYDEAIKAAEVSNNKRKNSDAYGNLANAYFLKHDFRQAVHYCEEAVKLNQNDALSLGNLGDALYWTPGRRSEAASKYNEAITLARQQLAVNPKDATSWAYIAEYSAMLGDRDAAKDSIERALSLAEKEKKHPTDHDDPEILFRAALVYRHLGDMQSMLNCLQKAIDNGYYRAVIRDTPDFNDLANDPAFQKLIDTG